MASNGRLPNSLLAPITKAVNGEQAFLTKEAALAFNAMNYESERRFGVTLRVSSARTAYRPLKQQQYFWNLYVSGKGNLAARPGTSNHGWGLAVDLATQEMIDIVNKIGADYGFSKKTSDAPTENWHFKYHDVAHPKVLIYSNTPANERRWVKEYDQLKRANKNLARRRTLRRYMKAQALLIKGLAAGRKAGWAKASRRDRYNTLAARS